MTSAHLAVSRRDKSESSSGVLGAISAPNDLNFLISSGFFSAVNTSRLSRVTISGDKLAGPIRPPQATT